MGAKVFRMNRFRFGFLFLLISILFTACGKNDDTQPAPAATNNQQASNGTMKATINGAPWVAQEALVAKATPHGISISGHSSGKAVSITISEIIKAGKFDNFSYESITGWYLENLNGTMHTWATLTSRKCQLEITKLDWANRKMSGTFAFVADSQASSSPTGLLTITNGEFTDVTIDPAVPAPAATMQMEAQVNNVPWSASAVVLFGFPGDYYLNGSDVNGHALFINGISALQPGSYTARLGDYTIPANNDHQMWSSTQTSPPVITITQHDPITKKTSGTYTYTATAIPWNGATGSKTITGSFTDVPLY
jgi:hypothetical protein